MPTFVGPKTVPIVDFVGPKTRNTIFVGPNNPQPQRVKADLTKGLLDTGSARPYESAWAGPAWMDMLSALGAGGMAIAGIGNAIEPQNLEGKSTWQKVKQIAKSPFEGIANGRTVYGELMQDEIFMEWEKKHPTATKALAITMDIGGDPGNLLGIGEAKAAAKFGTKALLGAEKADRLGMGVNLVKSAAKEALYNSTRTTITKTLDMGVQNGKWLNKFDKGVALVRRNPVLRNVIVNEPRRKLSQSAVEHHELITEIEKILPDQLHEDAVKTLMHGKGDAAMAVRDTAEEITPDVIAAAHKAANEWGAGTLRRFADEGLDTQAIKKAADMVARRGRVLAYRQVRAGAMSKETADFWSPFYLHRGWLKYVDPQEYIDDLWQTAPDEAAKLEQALGIGRSAGKGVSKLEQRRIIDEATGNFLGGTVSLRDSMMRGDMISSRRWANAEMVNELAKHSEWVSEARKSGFWNMSDADRWLGIKGKWIDPQAAFWMRLDNPIPILNRLEKMSFGKWGRSTLGTWKALHTAYNAPTLSRNMATNVLLANIYGKVPAHKLMQQLKRGFDHVAKDSGLWREAQKVDPGFGASFARTDIVKASQSGGKSLVGKLKKLALSPVDLYDFSEKMAKMAVYDYWRGRGKDAKYAAKMAMTAIFDYGDRPYLIDLAAKSGLAPFATYPYKALTGLVPIAAERPGKIAGWQRAMKAPERLGNEQKARDERRIVPPYLREQGAIRLPNGRWFNPNYFVPWGPVSQKFGVPTEIQDVFPVISAPKQFLENQATFPYRHKIWEDDDLPEEKKSKIERFWAEQIMPSFWVRGISNLAKAAQGERPERSGIGTPQRPKMEFWPTAFSEILGARTVPNEEVKWRMRIQRLKSQKKREVTKAVSQYKARVADGQMTQQEAQDKIQRRIEQYYKDLAEIDEIGPPE